MPPLSELKIRVSLSSDFGLVSYVRDVAISNGPVHKTGVLCLIVCTM